MARGCSCARPLSFCLRYSAAAGNRQLWQSIVHDAALKAAGMIAFGAELSRTEIDAVRAYVAYRINESAAQQRVSRPAR